MAFHTTDFLGNAIYFILFFVFIFFYPKIMISQIMWNLEKTARMLEKLTVNGKSIVLKKISKKPSREIREAVTNFLEFFVIEPISLDPFGIIKKLEHLQRLSDRRLKYFAKKVSPQLNSEEQANLIGGLSGAISLHQIAKIVRHFVELVRKTKNLQLAMLLQMQLPLIERISKALLYATEALSNGWPIGDSTGPLIALRLIAESKVKEFDEETLYAEKKIRGRQAIIIKAKGPGGRLGKLGKIVDRFIRTNKIAKIITIDAAVKLEGEKTGAIAEGVGVAIGGIGVDRSYIENITTEREIPLDSIVIKMSQEEALQPMKNEILNSVNRVIKTVEENIRNTRERGKIIVVGVGNCSGIGNNKKAVLQAEQLIKRNAKIMKQREDEEKARERKWKFW